MSHVYIRHDILMVFYSMNIYVAAIKSMPYMNPTSGSSPQLKRMINRALITRVGRKFEFLTILFCKTLAFGYLSHLLSSEYIFTLTLKYR
jgi:hypothetical protein